jgi:hypothetical protein
VLRGKKRSARARARGFARTALRSAVLSANVPSQRYIAHCSC